MSEFQGTILFKRGSQREKPWKNLQGLKPDKKCWLEEVQPYRMMMKTQSCKICLRTKVKINCEMFLLFDSHPTTPSPDVDSFPPLSSTVKSHAERLGDKQENERLRKRRKRRKQRKRSGSVSSSSSECSEKERTSVNSAGAIIKGKTAASLLTTDKVIVSKVDNDAGKVHVNVLCSSLKEQKVSNNHSADKKATSQRKSTSSCDGETVGDRKSSSSTDGTSNSPVQSDTDVKTTVTVNTAEQPFSSDKTNKSLELEIESLPTVDEGKQTSNTTHEESNTKELPKPSSWADLFKTSTKASPGIVIKVTSSTLRTETNSASAGKTEDPVQTTVGVEEDKYAKTFAGTVIIWYM